MLFPPAKREVLSFISTSYIEYAIEQITTGPKRCNFAQHSFI